MMLFSDSVEVMSVLLITATSSLLTESAMVIGCQSTAAAAAAVS